MISTYKLCSIQPDQTQSLRKDKMKTHACHQCSFVTSHHFSLCRHEELVHKKLRQFRCVLCDYVASLKIHLSRHVKSVHDKIRDISCPHCSYASSTENTMSKHIKAIHDRTRDFNCPHCSFAASTKYTLTKHMAAFHDKVSSKCPHCSFSSYHQESIAIHINSEHNHLIVQAEQGSDHLLSSEIHEARQNISEDMTQNVHCHECKKNNTEANILEHVKITHGLEKPFRCEHCNYSGHTKSSLVQHVTVVHYKMKGKCPHCSYTSGWKKDMRFHMQRDHPELGASSEVTGDAVNHESLVANPLKRESDDGECDTNFVTVYLREDPLEPEESQYAGEALDMLELTSDDVKKEIVVFKDYKCIWCSSSSSVENLTKEEMRAHLQENHSLTFEEYLEMNKICFSR